jgi:hypothetical protein
MEKKKEKRASNEKSADDETIHPLTPQSLP